MIKNIKRGRFSKPSGKGVNASGKHFFVDHQQRLSDQFEEVGFV